MMDFSIKISKSEYKDLIKESEQLRIVKNFIREKGYISTDVLKSILDIPTKKDGEE